MKSIIVFFFSLLMFSSVIDARKELKDYWKSIMKDQIMPEAIQDLVHEDFSEFKGDEKSYNPIKRDHFVKDFDTKAIAIIYHSHVMPKGGKSVVHDFKPKLGDPM